MIKAIIFDYDGVIVDSFANVFEVYKIIGKELGKKIPQNLKEFRTLYGYKFKECYQNLGIKEENWDKAGQIFKKEIVKHQPNLFPGIPQVIRELASSYALFIVSGNIKEEIMAKLNDFNLSQYFKEFYFQEGLEEKGSKSKNILKIMAKHNFSPTEVVSIGDRDIDYDIGLEVNLPRKNILIVNYGWGYNQEKVKQDPLLNNPQDLLKEIDKINTSK